MSARCQTCFLGAGLPVTFEWSGETLHGVVENDLVPVRAAGWLYLVPREKLEPDPGDWPDGERTTTDETRNETQS